MNTETKPLIDWQVKYLQNSIKEIDNELALISNLSNLNSALFMSVLKGEYYHKNLEETLDETQKKFISKITLTVSSTGYDILAKKESVIKLIEFYNTFLGNIRYNLDNLEDTISVNNIELDYFYNKHNFIFEKSDNKIEEVFRWLFVVNLKISILDEGYVVSQHNLEKLNEMYFLIEKLDYNTEEGLGQILVKTKLRCGILLYKILQRKIKSFDDQNVFFNNQKFNKIDKESYFGKTQQKSNELKKFIIEQKCGNLIDSIYLHYAKKDYIEAYSIIEIEKIQKKINTEGEKIEVEDVIFFTKHFRKVDKISDKQLKKVIEINTRLLSYFTVKQKLINETIYLDKANDYPYMTVIEHINNLSLKLFCDTKKSILKKEFNYKNLNICFDSIKEEFFRIELNDLVKENSLKFPSFIIKDTVIKSLIEVIEITKNQNTEVLNNEEYDFYKLIKEIFDFIYQTSNKLEKAVLFWEENRLMPIYVEIQTCNKSNVFLDSYYVLPSDYNKVLEKNKKNIQNLKNLETIFYSLIPKSIRDEYKKVFKNEVKEHQYSVITIIGLYAGFITYVLGNISLLKVFINHSIGSVLAFMLIFGVVMSFFIISLKLLFSEKQKERKISLFIWLFAILIMIIVALWQIGELNSSHISSKLKEQIENEKNH